MKLLVFSALIATCSAYGLYATPNDCRMSGCGMGGWCADKGRGASQCICYQGFTYNSRTFMCSDFNECFDRRVPLCMNGECVNLIGTYKCRCRPGYKPGPPDGKTCVRDLTPFPRPVPGPGPETGMQRGRNGFTPTIQQIMECRMLASMMEL